MNELHERLQAEIIADVRPHGTRPVLLQILELHAPRTQPGYRGTIQCEYCLSLCHSRSGLGCDMNGDAVWPCDTVRIITEAYGIEEEA